MSHLPGNQHYAWAADTLESQAQAAGSYLNPDEQALQTASVEATLALAYEQRTANLIALCTAQWPNGSAVFAGINEDARQLVIERLGL